MAGTSRIGRRTVLRASAAAGLAGMTGVTVSTPGRAPGPAEDEVLVGVSKTAGSPRVVIEAHVPGDERFVHENETLGYAVVESSAEAPDPASKNSISALTEREHVKDAERNADVTRDTTLGSSSVTVPVVDQGIRYDHSDLSAQSGTGCDVVDTDGDPSPGVLADEYHGTHVAGIAAGTTDDDGIGGISTASHLSGRALSEDGRGSTSHTLTIIEKQ